MEVNLGNVKFDAGLLAGNKAKEGVTARGDWHIECRDKDGNLKWVDDFHNLVTNAGLNHILDAVLVAGTQITAWYVGLMSSTPTAAAADTMASHGGWTEVTAYDEAARQAFTPGSVASQSVNNSASKAVFTISSSVTVGGAFLVSNSTKGGTTGTLYSAGAFSGGNRALVDDDVLNVQATFSQADDGV